MFVCVCVLLLRGLLSHDGQEKLKWWLLFQHLSIVHKLKKLNPEQPSAPSHDWVCGVCVAQRGRMI